MKRETRPGQHVIIELFYLVPPPPCLPKPNRPVSTRSEVTAVPPGEPQALALTQIQIKSIYLACPCFPPWCYWSRVCFAILCLFLIGRLWWGHCCWSLCKNQPGKRARHRNRDLHGAVCHRPLSAGNEKQEEKRREEGIHNTGIIPSEDNWRCYMKEI